MMLRAVREFFFKRNVMEVDCPALNKAAPIDLHIDVMAVTSTRGPIQGYLHTSPEYGMKRLLSIGVGDCYQMSHVFRDGELSPLHNPEFTMIEWYRLQIPFLQLIEEALSLIALFFDLSFPVRWVSYREALKVFAGIDYVHVGNEELLACIDTHHLTPPSDAAHWDKDTLLQFIMSFIVEPQLGADELFVIHDYPATQAALAQVRKTDDEEIAERFEVYFRGIELANGYHELTDPKEQERRLIKENEERVKRGKTPLPLDKDFVQALECGLPDCCGVAVGFDRLMMLRHDKKMLADVLPIR